MGVARTVAEARAIVASGRMAVFLGIESGFDHEGDPDVLAAFYRLGLRSIQFATQSGFNAFSDSALAATQGGQTPDPYHGINERGRALVRRMNELGILIEITHGTEAVHLQLIEASRAGGRQPRCRRRRSGPNRSTMSSKPWVPTMSDWASIWWRRAADAVRLSGSAGPVAGDHERGQRPQNRGRELVAGAGGSAHRRVGR